MPNCCVKPSVYQRHQQQLYDKMSKLSRIQLFPGSLLNAYVVTQVRFVLVELNWWTISLLTTSLIGELNCAEFPAIFVAKGQGNSLMKF